VVWAILAVLWAKVLGAESVVAISRKESKEENTLRTRADSYIATDDYPKWDSDFAGSLDQGTICEHCLPRRMSQAVSYD
jgi:D-arabinose 1-dehydrogenase-like Zn-dependent alcohol dehydrogenase